jgi:hypothetical protein
MTIRIKVYGERNTGTNYITGLLLGNVHKKRGRVDHIIVRKNALI